MTSRRHFLVTSAAGMAVAGVSPKLLAQGRRPIQIVVGFPAGGATDLLARLLTDKLRALYPQGAIVENRPGAAGRLALDYVKSAPADGSTLLFSPDFLFTIFPNTYKNLSYDPIRDFSPVATCSRAGLALSVGPLVPASVRTVSDFVQWCKVNPKHAAFASSGAGGIFHFLGVMFNRSMGIDMTHVPYKGGAPAIQDLVGGQIAAGFNGIGEILPYYKEGRIRALATFDRNRSVYMPNVPTMVELGYKDLAVSSWLGVFAPGKTSALVVAKLNKEIGEVLQTPEFVANIEKLSMEPFANTTSSFTELLKADIARWAPVVKASGFTAEE